MTPLWYREDSNYMRRSPVDDKQIIHGYELAVGDQFFTDRSTVVSIEYIHNRWVVATDEFGKTHRYDLDDYGIWIMPRAGQLVD